MLRNLAVSSVFLSVCLLTFCFAASAEDSEEVNLAVVKWILEPDDVWSHVADGIELQILSGSVDDTIRIYKGREEVESYFNELGESLAGLGDLPPLGKYEPTEYYADGDTVIVIKSDRGTNVMTGEEFVKHNIWIITFADGKIVKVRMMGG